MGKIKKILEYELNPQAGYTEIYPVTSIYAVYDGNNHKLPALLGNVLLKENGYPYSLQEQILANKTEIEEVKNNLLTVEALVETNKQNITNLNTALNSLQEELEATQSFCEEIELALNAEIENNDTEHSSILSSIVSLEEDVAELQNVPWKIQDISNPTPAFSLAHNNYSYMDVSAGETHLLFNLLPEEIDVDQGEREIQLKVSNNNVFCISFDRNNPMFQIASIGVPGYTATQGFSSTPLGLFAEEAGPLEDYYYSYYPTQILTWEKLYSYLLYSTKDYSEVEENNYKRSFVEVTTDADSPQGKIQSYSGDENLLFTDEGISLNTKNDQAVDIEGVVLRDESNYLKVVSRENFERNCRNLSAGNLTYSIDIRQNTNGNNYLSVLLQGLPTSLEETTLVGELYIDNGTLKIRTE